MLVVIREQESHLKNLCSAQLNYLNDGHLKDGKNIYLLFRVVPRIKKCATHKFYRERNFEKMWL